MTKKEVAMGRVKGVKEKLHMPLYDAFFVPALAPGATTPAPTFETVMKERDPRMIRFFVDVQNKTRLETNLQASGMLPSQNTFEARTMRVVTSHISEFKDSKGVNTNPSTSIFLAELIYNSVTTLLVGEKIMMEIPTFYFPSGAGVSPGDGIANHGEPDPMATFRFGEAVTVEQHQHIRVEMLFPHDVPPTVKNTRGPLRIWVVLDGYLTRDAQ
jgi:hypothetical protein